MIAFRRTLALAVAATMAGVALHSGTAPARDTDTDAPADIPAGAVWLGEDGDAAPGERVEVAGFRIDRHEVTNRQFARFVAATGYVTQAEQEGGAPVFVMPQHPVSLDQPANWWHMVRGADWRHPLGPGSGISGRDTYPVVQVSFDDATAYAHWAGGSLPSAAQWERAARGGQVAPQSVSHWLKDGSGRPLANSWQGVFPLRDTGEDGHVGLAPIGSYPPNDFGLVDMVGNVWEWTDQDAGTGRRVIKGGSYLCAENYCANYRPAAWQAQEHDLGASHIGFRIVYPSN